MSEPINPIMIDDVLNLLPHRYPFIMIDRVVEYQKDERLVAIKNVTVNEPFFQGHFPGRPIMPGVMMLESLAQACVILASLSHPVVEEGKQMLHFFAGIDNARFKQVVVPGDQLRLEVTLLGHKRGIWRMHGEVTVDGVLVCSADLLSAAKEITL